MYTVRLRYPQDMGIHSQDAHTHAVSVDLYVKHRIETSQNTHNTLILHNARDVTVALLALSNSPVYDAVIAS